MIGYSSDLRPETVANAAGLVSDVAVPKGTRFAQAGLRSPSKEAFAHVAFSPRND